VKLATGSVDGRPMWGPVVESRLHDVSARWPSPEAMIAASVEPDGIVALRRAADAAYSYDIEHVRLAPPVPEPRRVLCIGINYLDHAAETGRSVETATYPTVFTRFPSSLVGHGHAVIRPAASSDFDYEGELAVVIGRRARSVPAAQALDAVAGYSCFMDGTLRDFQRHSTQFTAGKNFDASGSWGPWIVTADEVGPPSDLLLTTVVNGSVVQHASTALLIHDVAAIVAYCSLFTTLEPGDVIATGTPGGVGAARTPPLWLTPGSTVEVTIDRVGTLRNEVVAEGGADASSQPARRPTTAAT